ncbi:IMPACT family protein [Aestuariivivens sediminis]|uniref:IMPACT family protein n=1 Tax=Aestuariivivens sediminis TaxID=2913557 RepID=UPI001F577C9D|nr:YigZ family protein [Aestuariivivens sediminis]
MTQKDVYHTITVSPAPVLFKVKNSKFFGYAYPVSNEATIKSHLERLKEEHHKARHWCYAYQIGNEDQTFRFSDDGEPNNSAGLPIYRQIQSFGVTNILIVVVRYFGGIKLGVGGLINAYKSTAQLTLEHCQIITKTIQTTYLISFAYTDINKVMRIIKEKNLEVINQKLELNCEITISVRKKDSNMVFNLFDGLYGVQIKKLNSDNIQ